MYSLNLKQFKTKIQHKLPRNPFRSGFRRSSQAVSSNGNLSQSQHSLANGQRLSQSQTALAFSRASLVPTGHLLSQSRPSLTQSGQNLTLGRPPVSRNGFRPRSGTRTLETFLPSSNGLLSIGESGPSSECHSDYNTTNSPYGGDFSPLDGSVCNLDTLPNYGEIERPNSDYTSSDYASEGSTYYSSIDRRSDLKPHEPTHINSNYQQAYNHIPSPLASNYQPTNMHTRNDTNYLNNFSLFGKHL